MDLPDLIPVSKRLYLVNSPTGGKFPMAFSFLALGTDTHVLIDTGCGSKAIRHCVEDYGVDMVINSHCHPDHVSGNHRLAGKPLLVPSQRVQEVGSLHRLSRRLVGPDRDMMDTWEDFAREGLGMQDYEPTGTFQHGDVLDFGGISLQAIHTPGHLEDHYCFLEPGENILLSFDLDLTGFGPFYGNPESDIPRLKETLDEIKEVDPSVMAGSHRLPVRENIPNEIDAFADKIFRNEERITSILTVPLTLEEICAKSPIFGKYLPGLEIIYSFFEKCMIQKHLECLQGEGRVQCCEGKFLLNTLPDSV